MFGDLFFFFFYHKHAAKAIVLDSVGRNHHFFSFEFLYSITSSLKELYRDVN